ncbi:MAG: hypothetical protein K0R64_1450 [Novosphingobium lindaniclasticum]|jgi:hypothetical protein|nr:hypothetical protein [Novosphingobium lindaniclasticum]
MDRTDLNTSKKAYASQQVPVDMFENLENEPQRGTVRARLHFSALWPAFCRTGSYSIL